MIEYKTYREAEQVLEKVIQDYGREICDYVARHGELDELTERKVVLKRKAMIELKGLREGRRLTLLEKFD